MYNYGHTIAYATTRCKNTKLLHALAPPLRICVRRKLSCSPQSKSFSESEELRMMPLRQAQVCQSRCCILDVAAARRQRSPSAPVSNAVVRECAPPLPGCASSSHGVRAQAELLKFNEATTCAYLCAMD